jgi:hypothetical protein
MAKSRKENLIAKKRRGQHRGALQLYGQLISQADGPDIAIEHVFAVLS